MTAKRVLTLSLALTLTVLLVSFDRSTAQLPTDHVIKIKNKGVYLADLEVEYEQPANGNMYPVKQTGRVGLSQDYAFYVPGSVSLTNGFGILLTADIRSGPQLFSVKVPATPICIHTWGTSITPQWTYINCNEF